MATALSILNRCARLMKIKDAFTPLSAEESADLLETLNAMLAEWHEAEIGLPDYSFASLTTDIATDVADREALAYALAMRAAPEYDVDLSPQIMAAGNEAMSRLRLRYFQPGTTDFSELPSASGGVYDINTDT